MKPSRGMLIWTALAVCAALVIGAMAWLTRNVLDVKRERAAAEIRAAVEEQTRLALWRMDAIGSEIILRENQCVPATYAKLPVEDAATGVMARFEIRSGIVGFSWRAGVAPPAADGLRRLREVILAEDRADMSEAAPKTAEPLLDNRSLKQQVLMDSGAALPANRFDPDQQRSYNVIEQSQRAKTMQSRAITSSLNRGALAAGEPLMFREIGGMHPVWRDGKLFLFRKLVMEDGCEAGPTIRQGALLDRESIRAGLLAEIPDLLPDAELLPDEVDSRDPLALVTLPFRLVRAPPAAAAPVSWGAPLIAGWIAVVCAIAMAALLVGGIMRLSERRASFVSAVTHELRTPLTTFRLYADMLENDAVRPEKRVDYLRVLSREADRLSHLVENVLAFSRIERGNARSSPRSIAVGELLEKSRERLEARLATAGLRLEMDGSCPLMVRADTAAAEHILFNLIDNAAKYAAGSDPPLVHVSARPADGGDRGVRIIVRDHGPGIPAAERSRVFRAFHKSAHEAAESQPGVGLGLALSRRLARQQGGELSIRDGAFVLRLPRA